MKRIGKIGFAALLVTGLGVQAYAVSVKSSPLNLIDVTTVSSTTASSSDAEVEATQLVFSLDAIEPEMQMEPAPASVLEVGSIAGTEVKGAGEQLIQSTTGNIISGTSYPMPSSGYAPATSSSGGGFASSGGGGFSGAGGVSGGFAGGSSALGLGIIGAAVGIPLGVSDDDDDVVAYPIP